MAHFFQATPKSGLKSSFITIYDTVTKESFTASTCLLIQFMIGVMLCKKNIKLFFEICAWKLSYENWTFWMFKKDLVAATLEKRGLVE